MFEAVFIQFAVCLLVFCHQFTMYEVHSVCTVSLFALADMAEKNTFSNADIYPDMAKE